MGIEIFGIILIILFAALLIVGTILLLITRKPNNAGARCSTNGDCTGGTICDSTSHTCRIPTGGTCNNSAECISGSDCASNVCVKIIGTNEIDIEGSVVGTKNTTFRERVLPARTVRFNTKTQNPPPEVPAGFNFFEGIDISNYGLIEGTVEQDTSTTATTATTLDDTWKAQPVTSDVRDEKTKMKSNPWKSQPVTNAVRDENSNPWRAQPVFQAMVGDENPEVKSNPWKARSMLRNRDKDSSHWKAQPVTNAVMRNRDKDSSQWSAQPITTRSMNNRWSARQKQEEEELIEQPFPKIDSNSNSNGWRAYNHWKAPIRNLNILDMEPVIKPKLDKSLMPEKNVEDKVEILTRTNKLRSQFVEETPSQNITRKIKSKQQKMEIVGNMGDIEVPVQYRYETDVDDEYLFGTTRNSSIRGVTVSSEGRKILDLCHFSSYIIYLHEGGYVTRETISKEKIEGNEKVPVKMNIKPTLLNKFRGNLYSIMNGRLYSLEISTLSSNLWKWNPCDWSPLNIVNMTSTGDGKNLYLQTNESDILYDSNLDEISRTIHSGKNRVYGYDLQTYIDIDTTTQSGIFHYGSRQEMLTNIVDAVILHTGKVVSLSTSESELYLRLRVIQWRPWYIKK